jgi:hypothetical protein
MTSKVGRGEAGLEDAFYALSVAKAVPDAETLDQLVRQYPQFPAQLTEMAVDLALDALCDDENTNSSSPSEPSPAVLKAMSRFHNALHAVRSEPRRRFATTGEQAENPFAQLSRPDLRSLGQRLNANTVFVLKLRDRDIEAETMTKGFKKRVADELKVPVEVVDAHFAGSSAVGQGIDFKADRKPEARKKQTFEDAVRSCGLTDEQQNYLLSL